MAADSRTRVGFIGLGAMGAPMATNLVAAGLDVVVHDVRAAAVAQVAAGGARGAPTVGDVARACSIVGVCVVDDAQLVEVVCGEGGLLDAGMSGTVVLHSTVLPETCRAIDLACREAGVDVLEVAVSGFPEKAAAGTLTLMMGGGRHLVERCSEYLDAVGDARFLLGPVGAGNAAKLANNVMWKLAMIGVYEGLGVARANGVAVDTMVDVARAGSGSSSALEYWSAHGLTHDPDPEMWEAGASRGGDRIFSSALAISRTAGVDLPVVAAVLGLIGGPES